MPLRVEVRRDTCCGAGRCYEECPEVFDLDEDGCVILLQPEPDESLRRAVNHAARSCPTGSVRVLAD